MTTSEKKPIKGASLSLLARQPYTTRRLFEKLLQKGYCHDEIENIIEWCGEAGYLDDASWAVRASERKHAKGWDRRKVYAYLKSYGISREDAENALNMLAWEQTGIREYE